VPGSYLFCAASGYGASLAAILSQYCIASAIAGGHSASGVGGSDGNREKPPAGALGVVLGLHCRPYRHGNRERVAPHRSARLRRSSRSRRRRRIAVIVSSGTAAPTAAGGTWRAFRVLGRRSRERAGRGGGSA